MTSILEPFASKRRPNETGTCSVYASVNVTKNVENNEGDVFTIKDDTAETTYNLKAPVVEAEQFKITASNAEIDKDENNAVNKRYLKEKFIGKDVKSITVDKVTTKNLTLKHQNGLYSEIYIMNFTKPGIGTPFPAISMNYLFSLQDRTLFRTPITLVNSTSGIEFNANQWGEQDSSDYPTTKLVNLVTSEISTDEMNNMTNNNILDNVCPTYKYCENNYIRNGASTVKFGGLDISNANDEFKFSLFSSNNRNYLRILHNNSQFIYFRNDLVQIPTKLGIGYSGIQFNTNESGGKNAGVYPQGLLKNLVPSTITSDELASYARYNIMDNVCPTYQYCENTYAKKSDISSSPTIDVFTRTNTRSITLFKSGTKAQISSGFIVDALNTDTTKFCDFFSTADENKFYVYNLDINFTMTSTTDGVTDSKMAYLLKTIYLDFNKNSEYFEFYENKTYMINFTITDATVEGHLTFTAMGNFKPASSRILGICRDFPSSITTNVDGTINLTLTFKRKEI